jgi:dihydrofolate synthase/folylpolyglutamate synthase
MNYRESVDYLYNQLPVYQRVGKAAYKASLENTIKLDSYFRSPHAKYKTIHVAGTNGKGSVCHMLASVLHSAGYVTGLHTSPHLIDFRERVKINGELMSRKYVTKFVSDHMSFFKDIRPSFFEISVFLALDYFASSNVEVAVIEVGLGGRLDSTNIINPVLSVITNIGHDHMEFLGDTLEEIAYEKAGIIKRSVPVIIGESDKRTDNVFISMAKKNNSEIYFADKIYTPVHGLFTADEMQVFNIEKHGQIHYPGLKTDLLGIYQCRNVATTLAAIDILKMRGFEIADIDIYNGLKKVAANTGFQGRWQVMGHNPRIVCDNAHNAEGFKQVISQISDTPYRNLHMVIGFVKEKNIDDFLGIFPRDAVYYFTKPDIPRGLNENITMDKAGRFGLKGKAYSSVGEAVKTARLSAAADDMIFIGGSTYVVADYLKSEKV